ncbi:hypothetical protein [Streptomyces sp. BPTC-684]|uniref:hypothetical protein n=1 Tax=Streptomyces sp. BPTC-684 TaxID=3043734 RepID=UPI0024B28171|nr:hypothetical protein [Streptomyces sp. BPTC-684]WHM41141.1 hypothetical protein QIY60_32640 [Streptomyces sp. BPTC-684]
MTTPTRVTATRTPISVRLRQHLAALAQVIDPALLDEIVADVTALETDAAYLLLERDSAWQHADQRLHEMTTADRAAFEKDEEERDALARLWDGFTYDHLTQLESVVPVDEAAVARGKQRLLDWMADQPESDDDASAGTALATPTGGERS